MLPGKEMNERISSVKEPRVRSRKSNNRLGRRGFTITELMVTLVLIGFAFTILGATFPTAMQILYKSRHMDDANISSQNQVEAYRAAGYGSIKTYVAAGSSSGTGPSFTCSDLPRPVGTITFTKVDANYAATTSDTGRIRIDATTKWTGSGLDKGSVTVTSLIIQ